MTRLLFSISKYLSAGFTRAVFIVTYLKYILVCVAPILRKKKKELQKESLHICFQTKCCNIPDVKPSSRYFENY